MHSKSIECRPYQVGYLLQSPDRESNQAELNQKAAPLPMKCKLVLYSRWPGGWTRSTLPGQQMHQQRKKWKAWALQNQAPQQKRVNHSTFWLAHVEQVIRNRCIHASWCRGHQDPHQSVALFHHDWQWFGQKPVNTAAMRAKIKPRTCEILPTFIEATN